MTVAEMDFEKLLAGEGVGRDAVPGGEYIFTVVDARSTESKKSTSKGIVFLTLEVQDGPHKGEASEVSINIPSDEATRGATFYFAKKMAGFSLPPEVGQAMNGAEQPAPILAEALMDVTFVGTVSVDQSDGQYAGSNNLDETRPVDGPPRPSAAASPADDPVPAAADDEGLPF